MNTLLNVSLRQSALFIPATELLHPTAILDDSIPPLIGSLANAGFGVSETLLLALKRTTPSYQQTIWKAVQEVTGLNNNWTPLVKGWDKPTGESVTDHVFTFFANLFKSEGERLACGHIIPRNTFPLERYNGCPFCGTPFEKHLLEYHNEGSRLRLLELWDLTDTAQYMQSLLSSRTALDATQVESLKALLSELPLPAVSITMKETLMIVIDQLIFQNRASEAKQFFSSPTDILRYLWYKHTGHLQIVKPKTIIKRNLKNSRHLVTSLRDTKAAQESALRLRLKYSRSDGKRVAAWINSLPQPPDKICELMHPKRGMWIRFIRALRLGEYGQRPGFEKLNTILNLFYHQRYEVWQGQVDRHRLRHDAVATLSMLKQRPGLFARSLFSNMLWFGTGPTIDAFSTIIDKVPARLVLTLNMYAETYFDSGNERLVKPLGGVAKAVSAHPLLANHNEQELEGMREAVKQLSILAIQKRFSALGTASRSIYIEPSLFQIPVAIGDRGETVQDLSSALMGTRFPVEGNTVRLFMQWGKGLVAQHMDMDLSCHISYLKNSDICSYSRLVTTGCKHSGDIQYIPDEVGTAEYIDIDLNELAAAGAAYVTFTCNAYSNGSITPNLVVGWMNSQHKMKVSALTGVAYDASCVQHQLKIRQGLTKGLAFGVLDVIKREILWLEMPFAGQLVQNMDTAHVRVFVRKLESKLTIGQLLEAKAEAQKLVKSPTPDADENYDLKWALNTAAVSELLIN